MSFGKKYLLGFYYLIIMIFLSISVFSTCDYNPFYVEIRSGSNNLGNLSLSDTIYIKSNIGTEPLRISFVFINTESSCFNSVEDVKLKLFTSGAEFNANTLVNTNSSDNLSVITKADFVFNEDISVSNPFTSPFRVKNNLATGSLFFSPDFTSPVIEIYTIQPSKVFYSLNDVVRVEYRISDSASKLKSISISGGHTETINFNSSQEVFSGNFSFVMDSSKTVTITARDALGNTLVDTKNFLVDSTAPNLVTLEKVYSFVNNQRFVNLNLKISDDSFNLSGTTYAPRVYANLSVIKNNAGVVQGSCLKSVNSTYICSWNNIVINLDSTQTVGIGFNISDAFSNSRFITEQTEIFVDKSGPEILEFYLINSYGQTNIFRPFDNNTKVVLRVKDETFKTSLPRITQQFASLTFISPICVKNSSIIDEYLCTWNMGQSLRAYGVTDLKTLNFSVRVSDDYLNSATQNITIIIDSMLPLFTSVELVESEDIKDKVIKSGENFMFKVFLNEENILVNGSFNVYAKLSSIDITKTNDTLGNCQRYNESTIQCDFASIVARNGYVNTTVQFYAIDAAGNLNTINYSLEILKIGNEVAEAFKVVDTNKYNSATKNEFIQILNPINRDSLYQAGVSAWFRGELVPIDENSNYRLVSYALKGCKWEGDENPILSNREILYGANNNNKIYQNVSDSKFALKVELHDHPNYNDMNDMFMICNFSVVKRDNQTIYGTNYETAEEVSFKIKFQFYAMPRGDLLKANAAKIKEMIEETEVLGEWFDTTYKIYNVFNGICTVVNGAGGMVTNVVSVMNGVQALSLPCDSATAGACTGSFKSMGESVKGMTFGLLEKDFVKKTCDWVTCRNGGMLFGMVEFGGGNSDITGLMSKINEYNDYMCSATTNLVLNFGKEEKK